MVLTKDIKACSEAILFTEGLKDKQKEVLGCLEEMIKSRNPLAEQ